jgi:hypothetical protein
VSNFFLYFQRKFLLVQHRRLKYATYPDDVVHTGMAPLSLKGCIYRYFEGEFDLPATKEKNMSQYFTLKCIQNHKGVFCTWNRQMSHFARNIRIFHTMPGFPLSIYGNESPAVLLTKAIFWCQPTNHCWTNRGLSWKLQCMSCHWELSHCPLSKVILSAVSGTKLLPYRCRRRNNRWIWNPETWLVTR